MPTTSKPRKADAVKARTNEEALPPTPRPTPASAIEKIIAAGDLGSLSSEQRVAYYLSLCESLGLNPQTRPFEYLTLQGKVILYARKDATDQLRTRDDIAVEITAREEIGETFVVTARASSRTGRRDESMGAVPLIKEDGEWKTGTNGKRFFKGNGKWVPLRGEERANAMMKAETKAKRRVTLSICGLGMLDETETPTEDAALAQHTQQTPVMPALPAAPAPEKNGHHSGEPPITTGAELYRRLCKMDGELYESKLINMGELIDYVREGGDEADFPEDIETWEAEQIAMAVGWAKKYIAWARSNANPGPETSE